MIEICDRSPVVSVDPVEYVRLLGYPRGYVLDGRAAELAAQAQAWYAEHGRPWIYAREARMVEACADALRIDGVTFTTPRLRTSLGEAGAHSAVLVAVGAGAELETEAAERWRSEKPDEYFFLEVYGSAVVEHLVMQAGARLCAWADGEQMAVLPHDSPGYPDWDIAEQAALHRLLASHDGGLPGPLRVLESGALQPKKSLLAVFGVTRHTERLAHLRDLVPCERCAFAPCQYRRAPYRRDVPRSTARSFDEPTGAGLAGADREPQTASQTEPQTEPVPLIAGARYSVNAKALRRWARERLTLTVRPDGSTDALFRFEGTTCANLGHPLHFEYRVELGPRREGYPIRTQRCSPASGDTGYTRMCGYVGRGDALIDEVAEDAPLAGERLDAVIGWSRPSSSTGCYCDEASRAHKWGLVLETIHYALATADPARI